MKAGYSGPWFASGSFWIAMVLFALCPGNLVLGASTGIYRSGGSGTGGNGGGVVETPVTGDPRHPADINPADNRISITEITAYASAWKQSKPWSVEPSPIPVSYLTRAASLWKAGELYHYDRAAGAPPLCWVSDKKDSQPTGGPSSGISFVTIGDAGNAADTTGYGAVGYTFQIQKLEFTNGEYAEFLNAVGGSNPNGIYFAAMGSDVRGGITQTGASPNFKYAVKANMGDKPVIYVTWFQAARVANWLHNGRSTNPALLETGAYTLNNATAGVGFTKHAGAAYWIPSENEWYKAAFYKGGGVSAGYWRYPTKSNLDPTFVTASSIGVGSAGLGSTANSINGFQVADWNGQNGNVTTTGSNGGPSAYGTYDMGGCVWEWNDALVSGSARGLRSGSWIGIANYARSDFRISHSPSYRDNSFGFRLARSSVP